MRKLLLSLIALFISGGAILAQCNDRPVINSFSPNTGFIGSQVTILGANFDATNPQNNIVYFGATKAQVLSASFGTLVVTVPVGASTAPISVTNQCDLTAFSAVAFNGIFCPTPITSTTYQNAAFNLTGVFGAYNMLSQDMDLDGKPEVISGRNGGGLTIAKNNSTPGNLSFSAINISTGGGVAARVQQHVAADFDGDGLKDILTTYKIFENTSTGPGNIGLAERNNARGVSDYQVAAGDFNNDGKIDIVGGNGSGVYVALNQSTGPDNFNFSNRIFIGNVSGRCTGLQVVDVDGDGRVDVLGTQGNFNRAFSLRNNTVPGTTAISFDLPEYWNSGGAFPYRCQIADFNKDGKIDLTTCNFNGATNTAIFINTSTVGDISFAPVVTLPAPTRNYRIGVGDVDGDGFPDIVTKSLGINVFSVYPNTTTAGGALTFAPRIDYTSSAQAEVSGIVIGDLDGDFVPDIATSGISSNRIIFHRNTSSQNDVTPPTAACKNITLALSPSGTASITAADIDNGSSDACGIDNLSISQSSFTCADIGPNNVVLTVTDNAGNVDSCTAVVTVAPAAIIVSGQTTVCDGQTVPLTANVGDTYQWKKDGAVITGATSQNFTATTSGDYTVVVTNAGGCSGESSATTITVNSNPTVAVTPSPVAFLCPSNVTLTASTSSLYQWKKNGVDIVGANVQTLNATSTGFYQVEVIDLFGCSAISDSIEVKNSVAEIAVSGNGANIVDGDNTASTGDGTDYGTVFPNVNNDQTFTISNSGSGTMTVSAISTSGANGSNWSISGISLPASIASGSSATFTASFNGPSLGTYDGTIEVLSDDCDESTFDFAVAAEITCVSPSFTSTPGNLSSGLTPGVCGAIVNYTASATAAPAASYSYAFSGATIGTGSGTGSGSTFNLGTTTVVVTATNACGTTTTTFDVAVSDNVAPTVVTQNISIEATGGFGAAISAGQVDNGSFDDCGIASMTVSPNTFTCNDVGLNTVTLTVTDNNGNVSTGTATVDLTVSCTGNVDLNTWTQEGDLNSGNWSVTSGGTSVFQSINGNPTFYVSPDTFFNTVVEGGFGVQTTGDDDFIGFVIGYNSPNQSTSVNNFDMLLFDWKQGGQNVGCGFAPAGMRLTKVQGTSSDYDDVFWCKNSSISTVLATNTSVGGWSDNTNYSFKVEYSATNVKIWVDNNVVFDVPGTFSPGRFGFYNYSQSAVQYQGFIQPFSAVVNTTDATCPGATDGSATANASAGGVPPYQYAWSTGDTSQTISGLGAGTYTVTVTASNCCSDVETITILDVDEEDPMVTTQNASVSLDASGSGSITLNDVLASSSDNCTIVSSTVDKLNFTCSDVGVVTVNVTVTDQSGNATTVPAQVTVSDNVSPVASAQNVTVQLDASGNGSTTASAVDNGSSDACGIASTSIDVSNFTCSDVGANTVTLTVTDNNGNVSTATATVTVEDNVAPVASTNDITVQLDASGNGSITVAQIDNGSSDACGIASTTLDNMNFTCSDVGANTVTLTVTDNNGNVSTATATVTVEDNVAPVVAATGLTVQLDSSGTASITTAQVENGSSDACGIDTVYLDNYAFDCSNVGNNDVVITVIDVNGNSSTATVNVLVEDNIAPALTSSPSNSTTNNLTGSCFQNVTFSIPTFTDACGVSTVVESNDGGVLIIPVGSTGLQMGAFPVGATTVTYTATDNNGNVTTTSWTVTVNDVDMPYLYGCPSPIIQANDLGSCGAQVNWTPPTASDNCPNWMLTSSHNPGDNFPVGTTIVSYYVMDEAGNSQSCSFTVDVLDTEAPQVVCKGSSSCCSTCGPNEPDTIYLDASGSASIIADQMDAGSTDNCGIVSFSVDKSTFSCADTGVNVVILTGTDAAGNSSSCHGTIVVLDTVTPTVVTQTVVVQLDASGNGSTSVSAVDNGTNDACGIDTMYLDNTAFDCSNVGLTNTVTLTATDVNGNTSSATASVIVEDNVAPAVVTQDVTVQLDGSGNGSITAAQIDNGSSDACGIDTIYLDNYTFDCANVGANTVTLTVIDIHGNSSTGTATVTVEDNVAPVVITQAVTVQLDNVGSGSVTAAQVDNGSNDACGIDTIYLDNYAFDCSNVGANTVTLTVVDVNGNSATGTAIVTVEDNVAPVAVTQDVTVQLDNAGVGSITAAQIDNGSSDACGVASLSLDITSFDCSNVGANTVTLTVTDNNGNSSVATATVTVEDNVAPSAVAQNVTVQLDANGEGSLTAAAVDGGSSDACGIASTSIDLTSFDCSDVGTSTVTLTVTDNNGNSSTATATVTVEDNVAPVAVGQDVTVTLDVNGNGTLTAAQVENGSSDACGIASTSIAQTNYDCSDVGSNTVYYTVVDNNGNQSSVAVTVTVEESNYVSLTGNADISVSCQSPGEGGSHVSWDEPTALSFSSCNAGCPADPTISGFSYLGEFEGHRYYMYGSNKKWSQANAIAIANGGSLLAINSDDENDFIEDLDYNWFIWMGLDAEVENPSQWSNGDAVTYTNWSSYNNNNCPEGSKAAFKGHNGYWYNRPSTACYRFIMEVECGNPITITQTTGGANGSLFSAGTDTITYVAVDDVTGATATTSFTVTVDDCPTITYCGASGNTNYEWIQKVRVFGEFTNNSGNDGGYGNYTNMTVQAQRGDKVKMKLYPGYNGWCAYKQYWKVYVDWNGDGNFGWGELEYAGAGKSSKFAQFKVPNSAISGEVRMRVVMKWGGWPSACGNIGYGEVEDYTINISNSNFGGGPSMNKTEEGSTTVLEDIVTEADFEFSRVYPNPYRNADKLMLELRSDIEEAMEVKVYSAQGQIVHTETINVFEGMNQVELNVSQLAGGVYFVRSGDDPVGLQFVVQ